MKIAVSVAHQSPLQSILSFERKLARHDVECDVYIKDSGLPQLDGYHYQTYDNPFYSDGTHNHAGFYLGGELLPQLDIQPTVYAWWINSHAISRAQVQKHYDVVVALDSLDRFDFRTISAPEYGTVICADGYGQHPLSADPFAWIARPSDYTRLVAGWKFFRMLDKRHLHLDMHAAHVEIQADINPYIWKYWLDVQNIKVEHNEV